MIDIAAFRSLALESPVAAFKLSGLEIQIRGATQRVDHAIKIGARLLLIALA
jgi:hypothetical protein